MVVQISRRNITSVIKEGVIHLLWFNVHLACHLKWRRPKTAVKVIEVTLSRLNLERGRLGLRNVSGMWSYSVY